VWTELHKLLQGAVDDEVIPGCAVSVWTSEERVHRAAFGMAEIRPSSRPAEIDTPWDLASLTKVLATTPVAMSLVADGMLDLDAPLQAVLPGAPAGVTAAHCLSHTSGLAPWAPLYALPEVSGAGWGSPAARDHALAAVRSTALTKAPGSQHAYSDLGFLLLGAAMETIGGDRLDALFEERVCSPSGVSLRWGWPGAAATEDCPERGEVVRGTVHDLNAHAMGGVSSHAGLFGRVDDVAAAAAWQLRAWRGTTDQGLSPEVVRRFWSHEGAGSHHLGWDGVSASGSSAGAMWPADGVGHLGFTGCSVWIAPRQDTIVVLVSNRVHPVVEGGSVPDAPIHPRYAAFKALRPAIHSAVVSSLRGAGRWPA
jgi:CubicO group peptidase (beta-lactamase class C family)